MPFAITTLDFPTGKLDSYAEALEHWEARDHIWHDTMWRPIGTKNCRNKQMHKERDGSITFKLYAKECVVWHPDNTVTVHGHDTMSTTSFINALTPAGVYHGKGPNYNYEPVLTLRSIEECPYDYHDDRYSDFWRKQWREAVIIKCSRPVTLNYSVEQKRWLPVGDVESFMTYSVDRKAAREVAKRYRLSDFELMAQAAVALKNIRFQGDYGCAAVADHLRQGAFAEAIECVPVGQVTRSYGRSYGGPGEIHPGFMRKLRNWIYDHEGVVDRVPMQMLTRSQYQRYVADSKRFS